MKDSIEEITLFFKDSKAGLAVEVQDSDYDGLVLVMSHLLNVKERQSLFEEEFVELKKTLKILSDFKEEFSDEILKSVTVRRLINVHRRLFRCRNIDPRNSLIFISLVHTWTKRV